ncbi:MAG: alpha-amylase family glycosyl hydrolase, partial [Maritimibacter sp.]
VMVPFNAAAVGEVGDAQYGLEILGEYTKGTDRMQMCYAFEMLSGERPTAARVAEVMAHFDDVAADGWATWAFSNHDVVRHITRWDLTPAAARGFTTLLMCLRGSACIYQGEELGLPEAELAFDDLQDPYGIQFWPEFKGRDGCRTPMVWERSNAAAGFSSAPRTWLPVPGEHLSRSVEAEEADPASLIHHYRRAIAFRHAHTALQKGAMVDMRADGDVLSFIRRHDDEELFFALNMGDDPVMILPPKGDWMPVGAELNSAHPGEDGKLHLAHWQPCIMRRNTQSA